MNPILSLALALALLLPAAGGALAAEFSADLVRTAGGQPLPGGKVYIKGSKIRMEIPVEGQEQVMIVDQALGKAYMLQPEAKLCLEVPLDPKRMGLAALQGRENPAKWRRIGRETIGTWDCEKRTLEYKNPGGASGEMTAWYAEQLGQPIKSVLREGGQSVTMEYANIKVGSIAAAMFTVPAGYQRMTMPSMGQGAGVPAPGAKPAKPARKGAPPAQE
ncbi:MAG: DUF4412 domain-containing protein [Acidobacteriota bacterium]